MRTLHQFYFVRGKREYSILTFKSVEQCQSGSFWSWASVGVNRPPPREGKHCFMAASSQCPKRRGVSPLTMPSEGFPSEYRPAACLKKVKEKRNRIMGGNMKQLFLTWELPKRTSWHRKGEDMYVLFKGKKEREWMMAQKEDDWAQADLLDCIKKGFLDCEDDTFQKWKDKEGWILRVQTTLTLLFLSSLSPSSFPGVMNKRYFPLNAEPCDFKGSWAFAYGPWGIIWKAGRERGCGQYGPVPCQGCLVGGPRHFSVLVVRVYTCALESHWPHVASAYRRTAFASVHTVNFSLCWKLILETSHLNKSLIALFSSGQQVKSHTRDTILYLLPRRVY